MKKNANGQKQASVRIGNRQLVLDLLRKSGEVTVAQLSKQVGLSKTTIWKIIDHFLQLGLVILCGKAEASDEGGKKPELYRFNENCGYIISIAIWGESVHLALTDAKANIYYKEIIHIQNNEPLENVIGIMADFIKKWQDQAPMTAKGAKLFGIVVAASGVVDSENGISITASRFNTWPTGSPIKNLIQEKVDLKAPFYIDNYNRYHAFAEKTIGQAQDKQNLISLIINRDGIGAGIIADGKLKRGHRSLTGEVGHLLLDPSDKETCHCGGKGCFEQLTSQERLLSKAQFGIGHNQDSELAGEKITLEKIFRASSRGDSFACELLDSIINWFAMALHNINLVFNMDIIILAGDYRNAGEYFLNQLNAKIETQGFLRIDKQFDIRYSVFDEEGALRGGACYVSNEYFENSCDY